jgi:prevent-host-death family protein
MGKPVTLYDAKTNLSELVDRAAAGEEITIAKAGTPVARLVPLLVREPVPGRAKGTLKIVDDFDAPLPDDLIRDFEQGD